MAQTPKGGERITQWVVQYRQIKTTEEMPAEELLWTRHEVPLEVSLSGPATKEFLKTVRPGTVGLEWRAIRMETTQRVEDW